LFFAAGKMNTVSVYLGLLIVGLRWSTLPEDVQFMQDIVCLSAKYGASLLKSLCKKKISEFTDSSQFYPRPPRTPVYESSTEQDSTTLHQQESSDESELQSEEDVHHDTEEHEEHAEQEEGEQEKSD